MLADALSAFSVESAVQNLCVDILTVRRTLHLFRDTNSVNKRLYPEQNARQRRKLRASYVTEVALYTQDMLVLVDETGSVRRDAIRKFGYSLRWQRCVAKRLLVLGERV